MSEQIPDGLQLTAFDPEFHADPYPVYRRLRDLDPVHQDQQSFFASSWTISEYALVKDLLRDSRLSVDPRAIGLRRDPRADNPVTLRDPDMMNLDEPDHRRLRDLVHRAFTPHSVASFEPTITSFVERCLDGIEEDPFDAIAHLAKPIPTMTIAAYIGVDPEHHTQFKAWTDSLLLQGYPMPTEAQWQEIVAADEALRAHMQEIIDQRRVSPQDDLVSRLIDAQTTKEQLSESEVIDMCCLLIGAGNFTTTHLIGNCLFHLLQNNGWDATPAAIVEESLRFDSPVLAVRRYVIEDITIADAVIKRGSVVTLLLGAANHDPALTHDPDAFVVDRPHCTNLSFGRGIHHCLGAALARLEATITVAHFMQRFPNASVVQHKRSKRMDFRGFDQLLVNTA